MLWVHLCYMMLPMVGEGGAGMKELEPLFEFWGNIEEAGLLHRAA